MSRISGLEHVNFTPKGEDRPVVGMRVHFLDPIPATRGSGESADNVFVTADRLSELMFTPAVGQEVTIMYNKFGKLATLILNGDHDEILDLGAK